MLFADGNDLWFTHTATAILSVVFGAFGAGLPLYFYFRSRMAAAHKADAEASADARKAIAGASDTENEVRDREFQRLINRYENQIVHLEQRHREQFEQLAKELDAVRAENLECQRRDALRAVKIEELEKRIEDLCARLEKPHA